jgi:hypothetical protein
MFVEDKSTATNLLICSATMFASIAVLMIYSSWKKQKSTELIFQQYKYIDAIN